ncbi:exported hypothetical protein [Syntrophobacter sp. SbD2]|nr:exported hypothetical protein [Syntrophobacter sp. SbD2]
MKSHSRFLATSLIVCLSIGIFAIAGFLQAAESDKKIQEGKKSIMEGSKQIMDGNKMVMDIMAKKGIKDAALTAAEKMMADGYSMVTKGESMMTGSTMAEGKEMVKHGGAKMMLEAQLATSDAVEKHGMTAECSSVLETCAIGEKKVAFGREFWGD